MAMSIVQEVEADIEILKVCEGSGMEPPLDLSGFFGKPFFIFVKADKVEIKAAGRARVVGEDLGDDAEALEMVGAETIVGVEVERG
jgi:hypothetical protein